MKPYDGKQSASTARRICSGSADHTAMSCFRRASIVARARQLLTGSRCPAAANTPGQCANSTAGNGLSQPGHSFDSRRLHSPRQNHVFTTTYKTVGGGFVTRVSVINSLC